MGRAIFRRGRRAQKVLALKVEYEGRVRRKFSIFRFFGDRERIWKRCFPKYRSSGERHSGLPVILTGARSIGFVSGPTAIKKRISRRDDELKNSQFLKSTI